MNQPTEDSPAAADAAGMPVDEPAAECADETVADTPAPPASGPSEADQLRERLLRLQADFDNLRKRQARERAEWFTTATEGLIVDLIPVVDHYELGLATAAGQELPPAVMEGFKLVYDQLMSVLKKQGVTVMTVAPGAAFDPHQHEAISHIPSTEFPADVVISETRRGYKLGDKLIRPLQVVVSSGAPEAAADGEAG
jgi:molecular chaperone GrpE